MWKLFKKKEKIILPTRKEKFLSKMGKDIILFKAVKGEILIHRYSESSWTSFEPTECKEIKGKITGITDDCIKVNKTWHVIGKDAGKVYDWFIIEQEKNE
jgi:hypothetical protein